MNKKYEVYDDGDGPLLTTEENALQLRKDGLLNSLNIQYVFWAGSLEEAMSIHYLRQGWGCYVPKSKPSHCPNCDAYYYPEESGECWRCEFKE